MSQTDSPAPLPDVPAFTPVPKQQHLAADNVKPSTAEAGKATTPLAATEKPADKGNDKASNPAAKPAHGTSLVKFMRNVIKKLESSDDEPDAGRELKAAGK